MSRARLLAAIKARQQNNIVKAKAADMQEITMTLNDNSQITKTIVGAWCSDFDAIKNGVKASDFAKHDFIFYLSADKRHSIHVTNGEALYISPLYKTKVKTITL